MYSSSSWENRLFDFLLSYKVVAKLIINHRDTSTTTTNQQLMLWCERAHCCTAHARKQSRPRALVGLPKQRLRRLRRPTEFAKEFSGSVSGSGLWRPGGCHPHHLPLSHLNLESCGRSAHSKRDSCEARYSHRLIMLLDSSDPTDPTGLYWLISLLLKSIAIIVLFWFVKAIINQHNGWRKTRPNRAILSPA